MKIIKLNIPERFTQNVGLKEIHLDRLGSVVALIGVNGAGKTRILKLVEQYFNLLNVSDFNETCTEIPDKIVTLTTIVSAPLVDKHIKLSQFNNSTYDSHIHDEKLKLSEEVAIMAQEYIKVINNDDLQKIREDLGNFRGLGTLIDKNNDDRYLLTNGKMINIKSVNEFQSFNSIETVKFFTDLTINLEWEKVDLIYQNSESLHLLKELIEKTKSQVQFSKFQKHIKHFLGKEFSYRPEKNNRSINSILLYNNLPFNISNLSPGQKTLFAYAVSLFYMEMNSETDLKESIIIIDEPEKYLHPHAQVKLIDALRSIIGKKGQLFIATHSVHIMSHLQYDEIYYVEDDRIFPPSRLMPGKSLNALMGLDDHIYKFKGFIHSVSEWAYANFVLQCFKSPETVFSNNQKDPQYKLFKEFVLSIKSDETLLLDYGAGEGRIGVTFRDDNELNKKIKYVAYEPDENHQHHLKKLELARVSNTEEIKSESFDCVLLCNVLHEIDPRLWLKEFVEIKRVLKKNGYLLFIEDRYLPKGENAHEFGYLILGIDEIKSLVNSKDGEIIELKLDSEEYKDRIILGAVPKMHINATEESVIESLETLKQSTFLRLKDIRKNNSQDASQGRKYANLSQLYINTEIAIQTLRHI